MGRYNSRGLHARSLSQDIEASVLANQVTVRLVVKNTLCSDTGVRSSFSLLNILYQLMMMLDKALGSLNLLFRPYHQK